MQKVDYIIHEINKAIGILNDEIKFAKSLESDQYQEHDITIENLEKVNSILRNIRENML